MLKQFFDKRVPLVMFTSLAALLLATVTGHTWLEGAIVIAVGIAMLGLAVVDLWPALLFAFFEAVTFGHGHLFSLTIGGFSISLRMAIFAAIMIATVTHLIRGKRPHITSDLWPAAAFGLALLLGHVVGLFQQPFAAVFDDGNGYWSLAYLLPFSLIVWSEVRRRDLLVVFTAAVATVTAMTLGLSFAFSHLPAEGIGPLYKFVRDARLFEVTLLSGDRFASTLGDFTWYFRVFGASQIIIPAWLLVFSAYQYRTIDERRWYQFLVTIPFWAAFYLAGSRSFFLAFAAAAIISLALSIWCNFKLWPFIRFVALSVSSLLFGLGLAWALVALPPRPDIRNSPFYHGDDGDVRGLAVSSRWNLLTPLMQKIAEAPVIGHGLGQTLTYISDDPRLRAINPTGEYTTYRFEWGLFDVWLKMGVIGVLAVMWWVGSMALRGWRAVARQDERAWLGFGLSALAVFVFTTHFFTPYLNHPIGLCLLLMTHFLLPRLTTGPETVTTKEKPALLAPVPRMSIVTTRDI